MSLTASALTGEEFHHTLADVDTLHFLADMLPPNPVCVNIGACFGTSTLAILERRPDAFVFSIDIEFCPLERKHHEQAGVESGRCVRVLGASQEVGKHWKAKSVDFVFVDGGHADVEVQGDIDVWLKTIKPNGIIAFHDYGTPALPDVMRVVDKAFSTSPLVAVERIRAWRV